MRGHLMVLAGLGFILASACADSGGSDGDSSTSAGTEGTTGGTGGTTTGGTGGTTGGLAAGAPCSSNTLCHSGVCGAHGHGYCCTAACATSDPACGATACDTAGACLYPPTTRSCGSACNGGNLTPSACDGSGACKAGTAAPCTGNFRHCADATSCRTHCNLTVDCLSGFYCNDTSHQCLAPQATGPCTANEACTSGVCAGSGTGYCCTAQCGAAADPACNPTGCDASGACVFPSGNACGTFSCTGNILTAGTCGPGGACNTGTGPCPNNLVCNTVGTCLNQCATSVDCVSGFYCKQVVVHGYHIGRCVPN